MVGPFLFDVARAKVENRNMVPEGAEQPGFGSPNHKMRSQV